jgi:hypothetical protein
MSAIAPTLPLTLDVTAREGIPGAGPSARAMECACGNSRKPLFSALREERSLGHGESTRVDESGFHVEPRLERALLV